MKATEQLEAGYPNSFKVEHMMELKQANPKTFDCDKVPPNCAASYAVAAVHLAATSGDEEFFQLGERLSNHFHAKALALVRDSTIWRQKFLKFRDTAMQKAFSNEAMCGRGGRSMHPRATSSMQDAKASNNRFEPQTDSIWDSEEVARLPRMQRNKRPVRTALGDEDRRSPEHDLPPLSRPIKRRRPPDVRGNDGLGDSRSPRRQNGARLLPRSDAQKRVKVEPQESGDLHWVRKETSFSGRRV